MSHRLNLPAGARIDERSIGSYDESTAVLLDAPKEELSCYVLLSRPGVGGPGSTVGEKIPVTVRGQPGFRNGAGAEGDYLMWEYKPDMWAEVSCAQLVEQRALTQLANAIVFRPDSLRVPFATGPLPDGYQISQMREEVMDRSARVDIGPAGFNADIAISLEGFG